MTSLYSPADVPELDEGAPPDEDPSIWLGDLLTERLADYRQPLTVGYTSGWYDLDEQINGGRGLLPGQLWVIAGRPGTGKSLFALEWLRSMAASGVTSLLESLEMSRDEVGDRVLASASGVRLSALTAHALEDWEHDKAAQAARSLADLPFLVSDRPSVGLGTLAADLRAVLGSNPDEPPPNVVAAVDYLQLMLTQGTGRSREQEVSALSRGLKLLAKQAGVPLLALSQLNRAVESRPDKRPVMSDLRESGSLEQDADGIILLYHPPDAHDELWALIAKQRNGPSGVTVRLGWRPALARIHNLALL